MHYKKNFSNSFLEKYNNKCFQQLLIYNNLKFDERIKKIMSYWKTFDNYSLSIMYLKFLRYINMDGFKDNSFIIFFSKLLLQNIHPNPEKRFTLIDTVHTFNAFLYKKNLNNIQTFEELTDNIIKNRKIINDELKKDKKIDTIQTKSMKILRKKS